MANKIRALKQTILLMLSGEHMPRVLMSVIRFCINTEDHALKKLLMLYWEVVPKYGADGKLLPEMILVCNALRNDLTHPNEYIRGSMLRFLCKLREPEILEPLVPSVKQNMEHRHSYVRRNAALAVYHIHHYVGKNLLPDAPELVSRFIAEEPDMGTRRNAFLFLCNEAEGLALEYLEHNFDEIPKYGDGFALLVLELTRRLCRRDPNLKGRFVRCLLTMMQSASAGVSYEAAWTLVSLTSAPSAVRAAAATFAGLLSSQSDNNVKLIILERLDALKQRHSKAVQEVLMDILRALSSPNIDICEKTLAVAMDLVTPRNILEVVTLLKKEVVRTQETDMDKASEYRHVLIRSIHQCAVRFPDVAEGVIHTLMDFLDTDGAMDVVLFVRSIVEQYPDLRPGILRKLMASLEDVRSNGVLCVALWVLGQYCETAEELQSAFDAVSAAVGDLPLEPPRAREAPEAAPAGPVTSTVTSVLADGTYATQTVVTEPAPAALSAADAPSFLRAQLVAGEPFLAACLAASMTKLVLKALRALGDAHPAAKAMQTRALLVFCAAAQVPPRLEGGAVGGAAPAAPAGGGGGGGGAALARAYKDAREQRSGAAYEDCRERVRLCCRLLLDPELRSRLGAAWMEGSQRAFAALVDAKREAEARGSLARTGAGLVSQADELIHFRQLRPRGSGAEMDMIDGDDLTKAMGSGEDEDGLAKLSRVYQLSSIADPVYAEAQVKVHDYDIALDITVINRTESTLTNLTVELGTIGDLKLVERPQSHTIGPLDSRVIRANIKVSSTETGHIFGTIVYDNASSAEKTYINLNDIQLHIMDYIRPATCSDEDFRSMWAEFEWENKVAINTNFTALTPFLQHLVTNTNMSCLTPVPGILSPVLGPHGQVLHPAADAKAADDAAEDASEAERARATNFLAANLYAKSVFGEDALVNVSVERKTDASGKLAGYIRIRSKTQGIALSLGDRITAVQRMGEADAPKA